MKQTLLCALALCGIAVVAGAQTNARTEFRELEKEYRRAMAEFQAQIEEMKEKTGAAEVAEFEGSWNPTGAFVEVFAEKAEQYTGSDDAVRFLVWIVRNDPMSEGSTELPAGAARALSTLVVSHAGNEEIGGFVESLGRQAQYYDAARCLAALELVLAEAQDDGLVLRATFARGIARMGGDATEESRGLARADLVAVQEGCCEGCELSESVGRFLFELDHLQVGMVAPDIASADLDGVEFKLSDYRGKVVVLDFWGDW